MSIAFKGAMMRLIRVGAGLALSAGLYYLTHSKYSVIAGPIANSVAKYLREKYQLELIPL